MPRRLALPLLAFPLLALVPVSTAGAETLRVTESFDDAFNEGEWTGGFLFDAFGFGLREEIVPEGGTHGGSPYLFRFAEEFAPEFHTTPGAPTLFHGSWRDMGVRSFSASLKIFQLADFLPADHPLIVNEQPIFTRERHVTLMLVRDPDAAVFGDECTVISVGGHHVTSGAPDSPHPFVPNSRHGDRGMTPPEINGEARGEGWETFHFAVNADSDRLPQRWAVPRVDSDVNRDGDPDFFDNACPADDDEAWRHVTSQVDQVVLRLADPVGEAVGIGQFFSYGLDDVSLTMSR